MEFTKVTDGQIEEELIYIDENLMYLESLIDTLGSACKGQYKDQMNVNVSVCRNIFDLKEMFNYYQNGEKAQDTYKHWGLKLAILKYIKNIYLCDYKMCYEFNKQIIKNFYLVITHDVKEALQIINASWHKQVELDGHLKYVKFASMTTEFL